jgi:membrane protease YdiL (CAAX protease family)
VLLLGWLEADEPMWTRRLPWLPRGVGPITLTSLFFAALHFRTSSPKIEVRDLVIQQGVVIVSGLLSLIFAVAFLRGHLCATAADLGWTPGKILGDLKHGLGIFLAVAPFLYGIQVGLQFVLPESIAPDPLPLFLFALLLGFLYYRTHRLSLVFVLHAALNASSLAMAWLLTFAKEIPAK